MVGVNGGVNHQENGHWQNVASSFEVAEIGDATDAEDLYENKFINVGVDSGVV